MALIANVSFSKKIPVEGEQFSSQGYSLTLQTEIAESDPVAIQARLHETFELVKTQVETELANWNGKPPAETYDRRRDPGATSPNSPAKASNRQVKYLTDLWTQDGGTVADLNARIREEFGVSGLYDLDRKQASRLLDELKRETRKAA